MTSPRILEEAVVRVQHFVAQQVEPLPGDAAVVQAVLPLELDHQPLPQILWSHFDNGSVGILKDLLPAHLEPAVSRQRLLPRKLCPHDFYLGHQVPAVLGQGLGGARDGDGVRQWGTRRRPAAAVDGGDGGGGDVFVVDVPAAVVDDDPLIGGVTFPRDRLERIRRRLLLIWHLR